MGATLHSLESKLGSKAWRLQNLYSIQAGGTEENPQTGLVPFVPNHSQRLFFNNQHNLNAILKARKLGMSTFKAVDFSDVGTFQKDVTMGIIDYTLEDAKEKLQMVKTSWEQMDNGDIHPETWRLGARLKKRNPLVTDAKESLEWRNGGRLTVSTSFRGRTPHKLHLSEAGKIAAFRPKSMKEIVNGAFNSVLPGMEITSESTHENGKIGQHYDLLKRAMDSEKLSKLSALDWKFHFFPWHQHPLYRVNPDGRTIRPEIVDYFETLKRLYKIEVTPAQMFWYDRKEEEQGYGMKKEFPSTPGEAFEALVRGAIWGRDIMDLRAGGRVRDLAVGPEPMFTFWDLGYSDYTAIWLVQFAGRDILVHDYHQNHRVQTGAYMQVLKQWERKYNAVIHHHFLPHDAESHGGAGVSPMEDLIAAGMPARDITVVPRTPDVWVDINHARGLFKRMYFDNRTDEQYDRDGQTYPAGMACLENYQTSTTQQSDFETNIIVHNEFSHPADGMRTLAAADKQGLIRYATERRTVQVASGGPSRYSPSRRRSR